MKKLVIFIILINIIFLLPISEKAYEKEEIRGVFISYIELNRYVKEKNINISKKHIRKMIQNIKSIKANTVILQVRAASDAIYDSKIFPYSMYISEEEGKKTYDVLEYFIKICHDNDMKLIAWINPYRVRTIEDQGTITASSPAYKYRNTDTLYIKNGIYYNPSKKEVNELIINGVKEVLNYKIDGVLFDDYFYPDKDIDQKEYEEYKKENPNITLEKYHLEVINSMIKKVHTECAKKHIKFGVSPDGNIDNNYQKHYADVKKWLKSNDYVDFIMPQIYYGFYNSTKGYVKVTKEWENLLKNKNIDLLIALAFYKVGREDDYAKDGRYEWLKNDDIIMREVVLSRNLKNYRGFSLFRYDNIFDRDNYTSNSLSELENLKKIIK